MAVKQIKIEDIEFDIPTGIDDRYSKATRRTIGGGLLSRDRRWNRGTITISLVGLTNEQELKLRELTLNWAFNNTVLSGISDVWDCRLVIDSIAVDYLWHDRTVTLNGEIQLNPIWSYIVESEEREVNVRWKYVIDEDFDTDPIWPANTNIPTAFNSQGVNYDASPTHQDIPWEDISGDWETDTDFFGDLESPLSGTQCLLLNADITGYLVAGWPWWENYEAEVWVYCDDDVSDDAGIVFRYNDTNNKYMFIRTTATNLQLWGGGAVIKNVIIDTTVVNKWYHMKIRVEGDRIRCYWSGKKVFDEIDSQVGSGRVGVCAWQNATFFDNFKVRLLPSVNFNLPASVDWTNQYIHADVETAFGTQKKIIDPRGDIEFKMGTGNDGTPATVFCWDDNGVIDDSGCVLLLHCDEGSGTVLYDASGKSHDSTSWTNTPVYADTSFRGDAGTCLDFDNDDVVNLAHSTDFHSPNFTIEMWIKFKSLPATSLYKEIMRKNDAWIVRVSTDALDESRIDFHIYNGVDYEPSINGQIELVTDTWYYIVATFDGTQQRLYIDMVEDIDASPGTTFAPSGTNTIVLGSQGGSGSMGCYIDEVRFHQRTLSQEKINARYRSEPYLHDFDQMTRAYHKSHDFKGRPVISNGLVMLSFPDYDKYEYRAANILMPTIYAWYENSWHEMGFISPYVCYAEETKSLSNFQSCEWEIEELTDQYCKMRITYIDVNDADWPEDYKVSMRFTIRNGFPGVLIEPIDDYMKGWSDRPGFLFNKYHLFGQGLPSRFVYAPEDNFYDSFVDSNIGLTSDQVDDNWWIKFSDSGNNIPSNAPSMNVIVGGFSDSMLDDYGVGTQWYIADSGGYYLFYLHQTTYGGIFFIPYDIDQLCTEAETQYDLGYHFNASISDEGDDVGTSVLLDTISDEIWWPIGTLEKGYYRPTVRIKCDGTPDTETAQMSIRHTGHSGTVVAYQNFVLSSTTYEYITLPFHVTEDIAGLELFCKIRYEDTTTQEVAAQPLTRSYAQIESGWTAGNGRQFNDNQCKSVTPNSNYTYYAYQYNFNWTGVNDIKGIQVEHHHGNLTGFTTTFNMNIRLCNATTQRGSGKGYQSFTISSCTNALQEVHGHSTDLWGMSQADANTWVKASSFGVSIMNGTTDSNDVLYEDGFQIVVYYEQDDPQGLLIDSFTCIPITIPAKIAHQAFKNVKVVRK